MKRSQRRDLTGLRLGRLTVVMYCNPKEGWLCLCDCTVVRAIPQSDLLKPKRQGCGYCGRGKGRGKSHGMSHHPLHTVWDGMNQRCNNQKHSSWPRYGGRGIRVCARWSDVRKFIQDMEPGYQKGLQLDRIDNSKGYSPENCRWVTHLENQQNMRSNRFVRHQGETVCVREAARRSGLAPNTLFYRISQGLCEETGLFSPSARHVPLNHRSA